MKPSSDYAAAKKTDFTEIPIISLQYINDPDKHDTILKELLDAAQNIGFFYIKDHNIDQKKIDHAMAASQNFFDLSDEEKATIKVNTKQRGWMAQGMATLEGAKTHDSKEVFFWGWDLAIDDPDIIVGEPLVAINQWPDQVAPLFKSQLMPYYLDVVELGRRIMSMLAQGLGLPASQFQKAYEKPLARGQLVYYPPATDQDFEEHRFGAAPHSDFGALTILLQDDNGGLQVQNKNSDWIEAPPVAGCFVCNIGDLLERWSNNRLTSTKHRVINRSGKKRYSIPIFCDPATDAIIDPRDLGVSDANALFPAISSGEYIVSKNKKNFSQYKS